MVEMAGRKRVVGLVSLAQSNMKGGSARGNIEPITYSLSRKGVEQSLDNCEN